MTRLVLLTKSFLLTVPLVASPFHVRTWLLVLFLLQKWNWNFVKAEEHQIMTTDTTFLDLKIRWFLYFAEMRTWLSCPTSSGALMANTASTFFWMWKGSLTNKPARFYKLHFIILERHLFIMMKFKGSKIYRELSNLKHKL